MLNGSAEFGIRICSSILIGVLAGWVGCGPMITAIMAFLGFWLIGGTICCVIDVYAGRKAAEKFQFEQFLQECRRAKN